MSNLVYRWLTEHGDDQHRARIDFELEQPLGPYDEGIGSTGTEVADWEKAFSGMQM